jgi:hypothetical protein
MAEETPGAAPATSRADLRDPALWAAILVGTVIRAIPALVWMEDRCVRDECTYVKLAMRFADGEGMTSSAGWIWAPGYPILLGISKTLVGFASGIKPIQIAAAAICTALIYLLTDRAFSGEGRRAPRIAAWLYALSPHMIFFSFRLWSEVLYSTLLLGGLLLLLTARERVVRPGPSWAGFAFAVGLFGGACVLFRGVATYMLPILMLGLLWDHWRQVRAWAQVALLGIAAACMVGPYSAYATEKFGGFMLTDRTLGQMMYLGNNDYDPITFDYGNGQLSRRAFNRTKVQGRSGNDCGSRSDALDRDKCQTKAGVDWIKENPLAFLGRVPMRIAQLTNPHSLLTRHLRWGNFKGMPQWMDELLILVGAASSMLVMWGGSLALAVRGKGAQAVLFSLLLLYHCAAIAVLAGLTRYRVPLEPLLMIYAAGLLAHPRAALAGIRAQPWRVALVALVLLTVVPLVLWYLPAGWPWWRTW